ncbi:MAG TPA: molybdopterin-dependent oxidoreductase [Nitrospira sp.]|nr:molybdopterin-dependent oxidoreductase [Nitrospira sp.]
MIHDPPSTVTRLTKGDILRSSFRIILAILVALLAGTRSGTLPLAFAQETDGLEAASNNQPTPTNLSPEAARQHFQNCPGGPSAQFRLGGKVKNPRTFNLDTLRGQPTQTTVWSFYRSGSSPTGFETGQWTGVLLYDLLQQAQITLNEGVRNDLNRKVILVTGSDCYQQAYAMGELVPAIGGHHQVIVAYAKDGALLSSEGFARIINPGDKSGARNVSNIIRIQIIDPPLPKQSSNSNSD